MNLIIEKNRSLRNLGIAMFLFFTLTVDFRLYVFKATYIAYAFAFLAVLLLFWGSNCHFLTRIDPIVFLWLLSIGFVVTSGESSYIIRHIIGFILLYCYYTTSGSEATVKVIAVFGVIYSIFSFVFYWFPDLYVNKIVPCFAEYARSTALNMIHTESWPGLTAHYSTNGIYLAMGLGALISLFLSRKDRRKLILVLIILNIAALLLIGKRAHLFFSIAASFAVYWVSNANKSSRLIRTIGIFVIAAVVFVVAVKQIPALGHTFERFSETVSEGNVLMGRDTFYAAALSMFRTNPLFGVGWKQMMSLVDHDVHNIYLQLLAETGIIGFCLYTGLIIYSIYCGIRCLKWASDNRNLVTESSYSLICFATYYSLFFAIYGMTGNPLYDEQPFYVYMISYGVLLYFKQMSAQSDYTLEQAGQDCSSNSLPRGGC